MIPRRMLGFGFALFLIMVILALIYSQYAAKRMDRPVETVTKTSTKTTTPVETAKPLPTAVTPDAAANDIIDEALADRDDLDLQVEDEVKALEEAN
ncbi:MAG: hypothetical protein ACEQSB_04930 [Undibacterium sp.]